VGNPKRSFKATADPITSAMSVAAIAISAETQRRKPAGLE
jgi:hypothetical protein